MGGEKLYFLASQEKYSKPYNNHIPPPKLEMTCQIPPCFWNINSFTLSKNNALGIGQFDVNLNL